MPSPSQTAQMIKFGGELNDMGSGTVNDLAGLTVREHGNSAMHKTVFTLVSCPLTLTDEAGVGQFGGIKLYDFPAGNIAFYGAALDADITLVSPFIGTAEGDVGVGTTTPADANALATTEQNIIPTTAIAALVALTGPINCESLITQVGVIVDGTSTDPDLYLNVRIDDDAAHATATGNTVSGTLTLMWANLGDQ